MPIGGQKKGTGVNPSHRRHLSGRAISRILSDRGKMPSPLRGYHSSTDDITGTLERPTRKLRTGRAPMFPYLALLRAEFSCFHSSSSPMASRSQPRDQCSGYSFCSTGPHLAVEGRYPLHCHGESGLSSQPDDHATTYSSAGSHITQLREDYNRDM